MAARRPPTPAEARAVREFVDRYGARSFTTRLLGIGRRDVDRMLRIAAGRGRVTEEEGRRILAVRANLAVIGQVLRHAERAGVRSAIRERAVLEWLARGKVKGATATVEDTKAAMRALAAHGYPDPTKGPYLREPIPRD